MSFFVVCKSTALFENRKCLVKNKKESARYDYVDLYQALHITALCSKRSQLNIFKPNITLAMIVLQANMACF